MAEIDDQVLRDVVSEIRRAAETLQNVDFDESRGRPPKFDAAQISRQLRNAAQRLESATR
jgi:hypothetical protein